MAGIRVRRSFKQDLSPAKGVNEAMSSNDVPDSQIPSETAPIDGAKVLKNTRAHSFSHSFDNEAEYITREDQNRTEKAAAKIKTKAIDKTPEKLKNPSDIQVRVRTGAIYILLTVVCILVCNATAALYLALLSAICAYEFYYMMNSNAKLANTVLGVIFAAAFPIGMWLFSIKGVVILYSFYILALLFWYVFWKHARIGDVSVSLFGATYTGVLMSSAMLIKMSLPDFWGGVLLLGIFSSIWLNDAFAYIIGSAIGKHKLAPSISPKKSWEGFIAGLIASMAVWCAFSFIPGLNMSIPQALVFGLICGIVSVLGDLVESRIKRNSGFKDSGTIMPGHGGLLDRCDSQFLATITSALMLSFAGCIHIFI